MYLSTYLHIYVHTYPSIFLPSYLPTYLPTYIPIYLSTYLPRSKIARVILSRSSLVEGDEGCIGPTPKQLWNYAMHVLHKCFWVEHKHNSFLLGPKQPSSPTTKELHGLVHQFCVRGEQTNAVASFNAVLIIFISIKINLKMTKHPFKAQSLL